ncbi:unnamed protein product [Laminaria digitata]
MKEWVCSICTFANAFSKRKCSMCMEGARPPGMGRAQPLSPRPPWEANRDFELQGEESGKRKGESKREKGNGYRNAEGKEGGAATSSSASSAKGKSSKDKKKRDKKRTSAQVWIDDDEDFE